MAASAFPVWPLLAAPFIGSFLGVLILRLPAGRPVAFARSACPRCDTILRPAELVPVLSWLASGRRCRHCGAPVSIFYPAIELAALGVAVWAWQAMPAELLAPSCALGWCLLALAVIDARHLLLPDVLTLPLIPAGLAVAWRLDPASLLPHAAAAAAGFLAFALIAAGYRRLRGRDGLGLGDAKLLAAAGAWVSWPALPSVVLLAAVASLLWVLVTRGPRLRPDAPLPLGPGLCLALWLVWLYGGPLP